MSAFSLVFTLIIYWRSCISLPCIPANTCFPHHFDIDTESRYPYALHASWKYACDSSGTVTRDVWLGSTTCEGDKDGGATTTITTNGATGGAAGVIDEKGDRVFGGSSGVYKTDYLQGINCPVLNSASDTCTDFFMVKHRGDVDFQETYKGTPNVQRPYLDIGDNCTDYINNQTAFMWDQVFLPKGCVEMPIGGSMRYECDANSWKYTRYEHTADCSGEETPDLSEGPLTLNECGYFYEDWNINGDESWWYWYDLVCCDDCVGDGEPVITSAPTISPAPAPGPGPGTDSPAPGPGTDSPAPGPGTDSPAPGPGGPIPTSSPNTTPGGQTLSPVPTSAGTVKPTAPTTESPTDSGGNVQPSPPTTAGPTSRGTAKPTTADSVERISMVLCALFGVMVALRV